MKFSYDSRYNIAYVRLREKQEGVQTIKISEELNIDLTPEGTIYGIELLNANEQLQRSDMGKFLIVNEATGEHSELALTLSK